MLPMTEDFGFGSAVLSVLCLLMLRLPGYSTIAPLLLKPPLGDVLPVDKQATFRLPNQSALCAQFINTYYLDKSWSGTQNHRSDAVGVSVNPVKDKSKVGISISDRPKDLMEFDQYFHMRTNGLRQPVIYTFTSPLYPKTYPAKLDCIKVIRAPSKQQRIALDFRGPFLFEPSTECANDYLEIRDGQFGFSPLLGRFCKDNWQLRAIHSSGQWLWLRFHSDFSIEKVGFQAVYYFTDVSQQNGGLKVKKPFVIETVLNAETGGVIRGSNLSELLRERIHDREMEKLNKTSRMKEFIIDLRTVSRLMPLLIHVSFIEFPRKDSTCQNNWIEIYDHFFVSDREITSRFGKSTVLWPNSGKSSTVVSKVYRACNQPSMNPTLHTLGRAVVRISTSALYPPVESNNRQIIRQDTVTRNDITADLPELTLSYTALSKAPCKPGWVPCMTLEDLRTRHERLNASGLSLFDVLLPTNWTRANTQSVEHPDILGLDTTYCVSLPLVCNGLVNCPQAEDEDECPRSVNWLKQVEELQPVLGSIRGEEPGTTTVTSEKAVAENGDFPHHTSIIVGLLGFCAFCGLLSAGMTLVNRTRNKKQRSLSAICDGVLFASRSSIMTTIDTDSVPQLKHNESAPEDVLEQHENVTLPRLSDASDHNMTDQSNDDRQSEANLKTNWRCSSACIQSNVENTPGDFLEEEPAISNSADDVIHYSQGNHGCKSNTGRLDGVIDQATRPLECIRKLTESPSWNVLKSDRTSLISRQQPKAYTDCRSPLDWKRETIRSTANSFGHLPNTIVIPVERLSDVVYHCGMAKTTTCDRPQWHRSGPLTVAEMNHVPRRHLYQSVGHLCETRSVRSSSINQTNQDLEAAAIGNIFHALKGTETGDSVASKVVDCRRNETTHTSYCRTTPNFYPFQSMEVERKRKYIRGGAPKRARYSIDPSEVRRMDSTKEQSEVNYKIPIGPKSMMDSLSSSRSDSSETLDHGEQMPVQNNCETLTQKSNWGHARCDNAEIGEKSIKQHGESETSGTDENRSVDDGELQSIESVPDVPNSAFRVTIKPTYPSPDSKISDRRLLAPVGRTFAPQTFDYNFDFHFRSSTIGSAFGWGKRSNDGAGLISNTLTVKSKTSPKQGGYTVNGNRSHEKLQADYDHSCDQLLCGASQNGSEDTNDDHIRQSSDDPVTTDASTIILTSPDGSAQGFYEEQL